MKDITLTWKYFDGIDQLDQARGFLENTAGVYVWIAKSTPHRVYYVGETSNFWNRLATHFKEQITGRYTEYFFDPKEDLLQFWAKEVFQSGLTATTSNNKDVQLNGKFTGPCGTNHPNFMLRKIVPPESRMNQRIRLLDSMAFAFVQIDDLELRKNVESAMQEYISALYASEISKITKTKIEHLVVPGARSNGYMIGTKLKASSIEYAKILHSGDAKKLPIELVQPIPSSSAA